MTSPNILLVMTDEERYPPPYESDAVTAFRRRRLPAHESIRDGGLEFHRHYAGSTRLRPKSGDSLHRSIPVAARRVADRWDRQTAN